MVQSMQLRAGSSSLYGDDQEEEDNIEKKEEEDNNEKKKEEEVEEKRGDDAFPDTESGAKQEGDREGSTCEANDNGAKNGGTKTEMVQ